MIGTNSQRLPSFYLPHGGGPWPWIPSQEPMYRAMHAFLASLPKRLPAPPRAFIVISAHWEEAQATLMSSAQPPMLYDYGGFPPETYQVQWPAPGAPELATQVQGLLRDKGIPSALNGQRGFDHGVFVPMAVAYPKPTIPTLQLSLLKGLDPAAHLALGHALAPLREQGVVIIGSGMSYHNMRGFMRVMQGGPSPTKESAGFDAWLAESVRMDSAQREQRLLAWTEAPFARECHPREEHLLPLHVVAGTALDDDASVPYRDQIIGASVSAVQFG